jgi:hypothetical protein
MQRTDPNIGTEQRLDVCIFGKEAQEIQDVLTGAGSGERNREGPDIKGARETKAADGPGARYKASFNLNLDHRN